jgi:hypothetical protein
VEDPVVAAARNNARWCDAVCRSVGVPTRWRPGVWAADERPPPFHPDRISLAREVTGADVLGSVPEGAPCTVKDSFAALDLTAAGFAPLFAASWIHRAPGPVPGRAGAAVWSAVRTAEELGLWASAVGSPRGFGTPLLADPSVTLLAVRDGDRVVATAALGWTDGVVGLSKVFSDELPADDVWASLLTEVDRRHPGQDVVGYEREADLEAAVRAGFRAAGPLQIWAR